MAEQSKVEELADNVKEYLNIQVEIVKLNVVDKSSAIAGEAVLGLILASIASILILFICLALGFWFSKLMDSYVWGFLAVAGLCLIKGIFIYANRKWLIIDPIRNRIIKKIFSNEQ